MWKILDRARNTVVGLISASNTMGASLAKDFFMNGNRDMYPEWSDVKITDKDHYTGAAYAAINARSNMVATIAEQNVHTQLPDNATSKTYIHPYLALIKESTEFAETDFWFWISLMLDLEGVAYVFVARNKIGRKYGDIQYMKLLNSYNIQRLLDPETKELVGYLERRPHDGFTRVLPIHQIIEIREPNPFSNEETFARTDAAKSDQFTLKTADDYTRSALKNNINAPGIMGTDVTLPRDRWENFKAAVRTRRRGEPLFSNGAGAISWTNTEADLSKSALKDVNEQTLRKLFIVYGVSKTIMGVEESGTTRDTAKVQWTIFITLHIITRIKKIINAFDLDSRKNYPEEFEATKARLAVDNPTAQDQEAEKADVDVKQTQLDLYQSLVDKGFDRDLAAKYVAGEIALAELGEPANEPKPDPKLLALEMGGGGGTPQEDGKPTKKVVKKKANHLTKNQMSVIAGQQAALENAIINIDAQLVTLAITRVPTKIANAINVEADVVTATEKRMVQNQLNVVLSKFYNVIFEIEGPAFMDERSNELGLIGQFLIDKEITDVINSLADKVSNSHIDTISNDIYETARELALKDQTQQQIIGALTSKFNGQISTTRARTVSRTETQRVIRFSQLEADKQLMKQNDLLSRTFKKWITQSDHPCNICLQLASEDPIPLDESFRPIGSSVKYSEGGKRKAYKVNFTDLEAGCAHPNCWCDYDLIVKKGTES